MYKYSMVLSLKIYTRQSAELIYSNAESGNIWIVYSMVIKIK